MNTTTLARLVTEIERAIAAGSTYILRDGSEVKAVTESDLISHLTTIRGWGFRAPGRQFRFPGIGNGWRFTNEIGEAGFKLVEARTPRKNTPCQIVVKG